MEYTSSQPNGDCLSTGQASNDSEQPVRHRVIAPMVREFYAMINLRLTARLLAEFQPSSGC